MLLGEMNGVRTVRREKEKAVGNRKGERLSVW